MERAAGGGDLLKMARPLRQPARAATPAWARWNPAGAREPWTVGVEEEVMLLEPASWSAANRVDDVLARLPPALAQSVSPETHACAIELVTSPHATVATAVAELHAIRAELVTCLEELGLRAAVAGTHPSASWPDVAVSRGSRYGHIYKSMRELARREPTFALHVHVAVPDGEAGVRALDGLRPDLPVLLALSANSPFWQARDSGLASARTPVFSMFPRVGIPRRFRSYAAYVEAVDVFVRAGAIPEPSFLWWDARLRPALGTIEVRIMDAQSRVEDVAALTALVQCLVRLRATRDEERPAGTPELLAENRFLASRDGMRARLIDAESGSMRTAADHLAKMLSACEPIARELDCVAELSAVWKLAAASGADRQRQLAIRSGLRGLLAALSGVFSDGRPWVPMRAADLALAS
jgi:glutamate---cysteine ligase / carboxylate-amine ligase